MIHSGMLGSCCWSVWLAPVALPAREEVGKSAVTSPFARRGVTDVTGVTVV